MHTPNTLAASLHPFKSHGERKRATRIGADYARGYAEGFAGTDPVNPDAQSFLYWRGYSAGARAEYMARDFYPDASYA